MHSPQWTQYKRARCEFNCLRCVFRCKEPKVAQQSHQSHSGLHHPEAHPYTVSGSLSKGNPCIGMPLSHSLLGEAIRIEFLWIWVDLRVVVDSNHRDGQQGSLL